MFKQSIFIYVAATLLGSAIAAPVPNNAGFIQATSASAGGLVACTNFDQSAAGFSSGGGGDTTLTPASPLCDDLQADQVPFPCTNIQAVADDFGTALCSTINTAAATSQAEAAVAAATSTATASASTGTLAACTNFDQSAAGFSSGGGGDTGLTPCDDLDADQIPFPCTNIQAVANAFGTALCSTINTAAATSQAEAAAASATSTASASTGTLTACTNFDQSAAGFSSGGGGDTTLTPCDDLQADQAPFPCTNIQAVANAFGTALCSTLPTSSTRRSLRRMF
ncbi:hypothetical protein HMN09_00940800 [Mycena chlorophos]|uniref:Uncharacterized protein n=1 Tax=Mycena chlorophos TaxID=658473 RepID=A0A8H6SJL5_MYCCL|nr:hypothetical protein HMN09_00940800 [Mycena chlorophos]